MPKMKFSLRVFANASLRTAISVTRIIIRSQSLCTLFGVLHRPPYTYRHVGEHGARGTGLRDGGRRTQDTVIVAPPAPRSSSSALMQDRVRYLFPPLSSRQQGCTAISIRSLTACPNITIREYLVNVYAIDQARFFSPFFFFSVCVLGTGPCCSRSIPLLRAVSARQLLQQGSPTAEWRPPVNYVR